MPLSRISAVMQSMGSLKHNSSPILKGLCCSDIETKTCAVHQEKMYSFYEVAGRTGKVLFVYINKKFLRQLTSAIKMVDNTTKNNKKEVPVEKEATNCTAY